MEPGSSADVDTNRSSKLLAWQERNLLQRHGLPDGGWTRAKAIHAVMRQEGVRQRLEHFTLDQQRGHLPNDPKAVQFLAAATLPTAVVAGRKSHTHSFAERIDGLVVSRNKDRVRQYTRRLIQVNKKPAPAEPEE
jgi:hypothetical protein